jgi:alkylated DNA nucleotide flippase Atl1
VNSRGVIQDRRLVGAAMRQLLRSAAAGAHRVLPRFGSARVTKLLIAPQDIRTRFIPVKSSLLAN